MNAALQLARRFREVVLEGRFIANTNYRDQLSGTRVGDVTRTIGTCNTIAVLAQHVHYYISGLNQVFRGGSLDIKDKYSFDFPPMATQQAWEAFLERFWNDAETFAAAVAALPDTRLDDVFFKQAYGTYRRNIEAMTEHSYYHLGQIVLLKKLGAESL